MGASGGGSCQIGEKPLREFNRLFVSAVCWALGAGAGTMEGGLKADGGWFELQPQLEAGDFRQIT